MEHRRRQLLGRPGQVRRAKIVATLGPATDSAERIEALLRAGVDVVRVNFSHGTHDDHGRRIALVRALARELDRPVAVLQDLQGPKIRTGALAGGGPLALVPGQELTITTQPVAGDATRVSTSYQPLPGEVRPGDPILLDDGRLRLRVLAAGGTEVRTQVEVGGVLGEHKGINLPGVPISAPALTEKDQDDLAFGLAQQVDYVALSFVRRAQDMHDARRWLAQRDAAVPLIAKLETAAAIDDLGAIVAASDGVMVARGDLGVELGPELVPILQKRIIRAANRRGIPALTATQMLESMTASPTPTRAEAADVANAVWDGTDALMLSGETAVGHYPVEVVATMARIALAAEAAQLPVGPRDLPRVSLAHALSRAARSLAEDLDVPAIVAFTRTGRTAHLLSQDRPRAPILALTPDEQVYRRLALWWGVRPLACALAPHTEALVQQMEQEVLRRGLAQRGQSVVVVGAMPLEKGVHTNFVKVHTIGRGR
ncbi:MAG: pyruvate kinase [Chloroflexi bacterium]|nr:pyruvate kinase [Chloroflexota bacterium]